MYCELVTVPFIKQYLVLIPRCVFRNEFKNDDVAYFPSASIWLSQHTTHVILQTVCVWGSMELDIQHNSTSFGRQPNSSQKWSLKGRGCILCSNQELMPWWLLTRHASIYRGDGLSEEVPLYKWSCYTHHELYNMHVMYNIHVYVLHYIMYALYMIDLSQSLDLLVFLPHSDTVQHRLWGLGLEAQVAIKEY